MVDVRRAGRARRWCEVEASERKFGISEAI